MRDSPMARPLSSARSGVLDSAPATNSHAPSRRAAIRWTAPMNASLPPPTMPSFSGVAGSRIAVIPSERGVERACWRLEVERADVRRALGRAVHAVHAAVFPFDRQRPAVADVVQGDDDLLEVDVATTDAAEVPVAARVAERGVAAEHAGGAVAAPPPDVLHVNVHDARGEAP